MNVIFVMINYSGYEGHGPPIQAFERLDDARSAVALVNAAGTAFGEPRVYAVPVWPVMQKSQHPVAVPLE